MSWVKSDSGASQEKCNQLPDLFEEIRFPLIHLAYIREIIENEELVKQDQICLDMLVQAQDYHLKSADHVINNSKLLTPRMFMGVVCGLVCPGGWRDNAPSKEVCVYVTSHSKWYPITALPQARYAHSVIASDDYIYVLGGRDNTCKLLSSVIRFDMTTNNWHSVMPLPYPATSLGVCVFQGQLFVVGGLTGIGSVDIVLRYSPRYNSWQRVKNLNQPRSGAAVVGGEKYMYAIGGLCKSTNKETQWEFLNTMEVYQRESNKWTLGKNLLSKRAYAAAVYLNSRIYLVGGRGELMGVNRGMDVYDPHIEEWTSAVCHSTPRTLCGIALSENETEFYVIGGVTSGGEDMDGVEVYDTEKDRWKKATSLPVPTGALKCCSMKLKLAVLKDLCNNN